LLPDFFETGSRAQPRLTVLGPSVIAMVIRNEKALPRSKVERLKNQKTLRLLLRDVAGKEEVKHLGISLPSFEIGPIMKAS